MTDQELPLAGQVLGHVEVFTGSEDGSLGAPVPEVETLDEANVITSKVASTANWMSPLHKVVIDVDMPVTLVPSSTPGHFHLYIDHLLSWSSYKELLLALVNAGIIQQGYFDSSIMRGHTTLRLPWIKKEDEPKPSDDEWSF